jgi:hypothetical protein
LSVGTHTITAEVTDSGGNTVSNSIAVTIVDNSGGGSITLSVNAYKVRGVKHADLSWSGATSDIDVYRDDVLVASTANDGAYTDNTGQKGGGSFAYQVCETGGTSTCSNVANAVY